MRAISHGLDEYREEVDMFVKASLKSALLGSVVLASGMIAYAQDADSSDEEARELDKVVVVGSQIVGSDIAGALPVTVLSVDDIDVTGAASGELEAVSAQSL